MPKQKEYQSFTTYSDLFASEPYTPLLFQTEREANGALKVLSLFSGCGGMDLGFEGSFICHKKSIPTYCDWVQKTVADNWVLLKSTRFKTIFANDILKEAQQSWLQYMRRFDVPKEIYHFGSIVDYVKMHRKGVSVFPENVDVVTGGFPCQDFSVAGKRKGFESTMSHDGCKQGINAPSEETRGKLYFWMKQVIDIVRPKVFIAENVKGLVSLGDVKSIIQHDFASADGNGYIVLNPRVLDAGNYGVPETRERVIFIGIRRNALTKKALRALESDKIPNEYDPYPKPTHNHTAQDNSLKEPVTCRDVFEGLKEPEESCDLSQRNYSMAKYMGKHCQGQSEIKLDGLGPTIRSEHHGNIEFRRLSKEHGGIYTDELNKGMKERRLTPRECALIQTFPPDYPFVFYRGYTKTYGVSPSGAYKVIGNAVPPMLAYNIAQRLQSIWSLYFE
jgi:DNA (cytosine-5)-methyltransferase 1